MKKVSVSAIISLVLMSGCMSATEMAMLSGDPNTAIDLMRGTGSISASNTGQTTFRYVSHAKAFDGVIPAEQQEAARMDQLSIFLGGTGQCSDGWSVRNTTQTDLAYIYEGTCN